MEKFAMYIWKNSFLFLISHFKEGGASVITDFQGSLRLHYAQKNNNYNIWNLIKMFKKSNYKS